MEEHERLSWLRRWYVNEIRARAERYRSALVGAYGESGKTIECAEIYEVSEYASQPTDALRKRLFSVGRIRQTDSGT